MAENSIQLDNIVALKLAFEALFADDPWVAVHGDLLWYPVEGNNRIRVAPDTMVIFGRPRGPRGSYRQREEGDVAPQVVFEIVSPGNRPSDHIEKFLFCNQYGVEEYYVFDPERHDFSAWYRCRGELVRVDDSSRWVSPRLGVRFRIEGEMLRVIDADQVPVPTYDELQEQLATERRRTERLARKLRELGVHPD